MVFCRGCAKEIHETAPMCPQCGAPQAVANTSQPTVSKPVTSASNSSLENKLHIVLIASAVIAMVLLYTTHAMALIGAGTGLSFGLSLRLFLYHKKNGFQGTNQLDWVLLLVFSTAAFILMFTEDYYIQALLLIFVAVRGLMMYLKINSSANKSA